MKKKKKKKKKKKDKEEEEKEKNLICMYVPSMGIIFTRKGWAAWRHSGSTITLARMY